MMVVALLQVTLPGLLAHPLPVVKTLGKSIIKNSQQTRGLFCCFKVVKPALNFVIIANVNYQ